MTRVFDIIFSVIGVFILGVFLIPFLIIGYFETGSPIFRQKRIGKNQKPFFLLKLRSMRINTPSLATHLTDKSYLTSFGKFLRKTKIDELPQLWNVLIGDMSIVGPRPNLPNQKELIHERASLGVYSVRPGMTGLAQINKIDMSTPKSLAKIDAYMIQELQLKSYFRYIILTLLGKGF